jgi:hypothetical protein
MDTHDLAFLYGRETWTITKVKGGGVARFIALVAGHQCIGLRDGQPVGL